MRCKIQNAKMQKRTATDSLTHSISNATHKLLDETLHWSGNNTPNKEHRSSSFGASLDSFKKTLNLAHLLDPSRETELTNAHRLINAKATIAESYKRLKSALKELQDDYMMSKYSLNIYQRYTDMKHMIKRVLTLETHQWLLIDLPNQTSTENETEYVFRILNCVEEQQCKRDEEIYKCPAKLINSIDNFGHLEKSPSRYSNVSDQLKTKATDDLKKENVCWQTEIYILTNKYSSLRDLTARLKDGYQSSKSLQTIQRYNLFKHLIKEIVRAPAFTTVCQEIDYF